MSGIREAEKERVGDSQELEVGKKRVIMPLCSIQVKS